MAITCALFRNFKFGRWLISLKPLNGADGFSLRTYVLFFHGHEAHIKLPGIAIAAEEGVFMVAEWWIAALRLTMGRKHCETVERTRVVVSGFQVCW